DLGTGGSNKYSLLTIASLMAWGLGYFGMPHVLLRFMAIEDKNKIKTSRRIASVWVVISMAVAIFIGFIGNAITKAGSLEVLDGSNSELLAASSSMSENIIKGVFGIKLTEKQSMLIARVVLMVIAILGVVLAWNSDSSVFRIVSFAWAGFGATFGPVMLTSLFWKRSNKYGAISGMIVGAVMVFLWKFVISKLGGVFAIYELLPAFIAALAVIII
ncbi:MAG: sodium:proline symporter, partial [Clostridia bacterium]|nr:sodium:proline symporter [Clostridia bacterium]